MTFKSNTRYALKDPTHRDNDEGQGYGYAETLTYADGTYIADCWITNADGDIHPGYAESPIPVRFDDVIADSGQPSVNSNRPRSTAMWA